MGRHQLRLEPDAHGKGPVAKDLGTLNAGDGAQFRLHDPSQIVGNLVLIEVGRRKTEIERRELGVGILDFDDRRLGLGRQLVAHLRHLRLDLRQGVVGVVVEPQVDGDRAETLAARRFHVVDAIGAGDDPLERRGDETADEIRIRAGVHRRHAHHGNVTARVLPDTQRADRLQARDENDQIDDDGQDRPLDEQIGERHLAVFRLWRPVVGRLHVVVDLHRCTVAELEGTGRHDFVTRRDA